MSPLPSNINTRERDKFEDNGAKKTSVRSSIFGRKLNTLKAVKTTVGVAATKIEIPEEADIVKIFHIEAGETLFLGENSLITTAATNVIAIPDKYEITLEVTKGNNNNIYGIVSAGTIAVYAYSMVKE